MRAVIVFTLLALVVTFMASAACNENPIPAADQLQKQATDKMAAEAHKAVGMPDVTNWQEKKLARDIAELRDKADLPTWTYIIDMNGKRHLLGRSLGYGLPYSVRFTNPEKLVTGGTANSYWAVTLPQPEANGLFMPEGLSATWVLLLNPKTGKPEPVYVEPEIVVSPFELEGQ